MDPVNIEQLVGIVLELKEQVQRMADALQKQEDRKEYQAEYYKKRKAAKKEKSRSSKLENPKGFILNRKDERLPFRAWGLKMKEFADRGLSPYNFLTWLTWAWNQNTYQHVPITKSGGYMHVYLGMSAQEGRPLRSKHSERDVTGHVRVRTFRNKTQQDTFSSGLWWKFGYCVLNGVVGEVQDEKWYEALGQTWHRPMKVLQGGYGMYEVMKDVYFDPNEPDLHLASKMYGMVRPTLVMGWGAALRGFFTKEEPFTVAKP